MEAITDFVSKITKKDSIPEDEEKHKDLLVCRGISNPRRANNIYSESTGATFLNEHNCYRSWNITVCDLDLWLSVAINRAEMMWHFSPHTTTLMFLLIRATATDSSLSTMSLIQELHAAFDYDRYNFSSKEEIINWVKTKNTHHTKVHGSKLVELIYDSTYNSFVYPIPRNRQTNNINWNLVKTHFPNTV